MFGTAEVLCRSKWMAGDEDPFCVYLKSQVSPCNRTSAFHETPGRDAAETPPWCDESRKVRTLSAF